MRFVFLFILYFITTNTFSQIDSVFFNEHKKYIKDLYRFRGAPPEWLESGDVNIKDVTKLLKEYNDEVGVLIYTYKNDTLNISLIDRSEKINSLEVKVNENEFVKKITKVNQLFSSSFSKKIPNRGIITSSEINKKKKEELLINFNEVNKILFPPSLNFEKYNHLIIVPTLNIGSLPLASFKVKDKFLIDYLSYSLAPSLFELMISYKKQSENNTIGKMHCLLQILIIQKIKLFLFQIYLEQKMKLITLLKLQNLKNQTYLKI